MMKLAPQNRLISYGANLVEVPFLSYLVNSTDESVSACLFLTSVTLIGLYLSNLSQVTNFKKHKGEAEGRVSATENGSDDNMPTQLLFRRQRISCA